MIGYLLRRLGHAAITWLVAVALIFIAVRVLPGNPLLTRFGQHPDAQQIAELSREHGWDRPVWIQLGEFYYRLFTTGDLGQSIARNTDISGELAVRIPATLELTFAAIFLALPLGVLAGVISAKCRGRWPDFLVSTLALVGVSVPIFFLGILLREVFTDLPTAQRLSAHDEASFDAITGLYLIDVVLRGRFDLLPQVIAHLILPAVTLATVPAASIAKIARGAMLDTLQSDYIRTARAKGADWWRVLARHALPNAAVPIANIGGLQIGLLLTGAVLTETVFDWPGMGRYLADAVVNDRNYNVVQAGAIVIAGMFTLLNLLLDLVYMALDPRIRLHDRAGRTS